MKKMLIGLLAACMLTSSFAGCGSKPADTPTDKPAADASTATPADQPAESTPAEGTADVNEDGTVNNPEAVKVDENKLVFWSLFSGGDGKFMDQIITDYNATNPSKQVQSVMLVWADYYTKLMTAVAANKGPDIGVSHLSRLPELTEQGIIQPLDDPANAAGVDFTKFNDNMNASITFDGQKYAVPLDTHAEILYFNKDLLEQAKIPVEADGSVKIGSWDEFKAMLVKCKEVLPEGSALSLGQTGDDPWRVWWSCYFQMGGTPILSDDGTSVTMDKAIAQKAAEEVNSLYTEGLIQAGIQDHQKYFQGGSAAFEFGGTWAVGVYEGTDGFNYGGQTFPKFFDQDASYADCHVFTLPTNKDRTDDETKSALSFINYATSEGQTTWAGSGQIVANSDVQASEEFNKLPNRSLYKSAAETAVLPFASARYGAMKEAMIRSLDSLFAGQVDAAAAIETMVSELESNL